MRTLQEWMRHRDIATTQRYADYAPAPEHERELVAAAFASGQGPRPPRLGAATHRTAGREWPSRNSLSVLCDGYFSE